MCIRDSYTQEQVDAIARMFAKVVYDNAEELAKMAVEESRMGVYQDKVAKCLGSFTRQHSPLITPLCYLVEVVPYPIQLRDKFLDTVRIHDLLLQHTGKDIFLLVLCTL